MSDSKPKKKKVPVWPVVIGLPGGAMVAHIIYEVQARAEIAEMMERNPRILGASVNYGNFPHMQYLLWGLLGGVLVGAVLAALLGKRA